MYQPTKKPISKTILFLALLIGESNSILVSIFYRLLCPFLNNAFSYIINPTNTTTIVIINFRFLFFIGPLLFDLFLILPTYKYKG